MFIMFIKFMFMVYVYVYQVYKNNPNYPVQVIGINPSAFASAGVFAFTSHPL